MSHRRASAACLSTVLLTVVLTAGPAVADNELGGREGADPGPGLSVGMTLVLYILIPAAIMLGIAVLVLLPGLVKAERYRPQRGWSAAPVWFAGPPDPVAAVQNADTGDAGRGGASGSW